MKYEIKVTKRTEDGSTTLLMCTVEPNLAPMLLHSVGKAIELENFPARVVTGNDPQPEG